VKVFQFPEGYPPLAYCRSCGRDFTGDSMFEAHRVGDPEFTYEQGLAMEPMREDGRRCMDEDEMREKGWRPLTEDEMLASRRDKHRVGFGVELWHDPAQVARVREAFAKRKENDDA
jgi:hypothetical protein